MILLFLFPLIVLFRHNTRVAYAFFFGFIWGLIAYGLHFFWLYDLLATKSTASVSLSFLLYGLIVVYAALTSAAWFFLAHLFSHYLHHVLAWIVSSIIYFTFISYAMFWFLGSGYPFLNPLIPLMTLRGITSAFHNLQAQKKVVISVDKKKYAFVYCAPCKKKDDQDDAVACAMQIYEQLKALQLHTWAEHYEQVFVVGPETTFPYALNKNKKIIAFWGTLLPANTTMIIGSTRLEKKRLGCSNLGCSNLGWPKLYQTVYWTGASLIINHYDKTHRVPFAEKLSSFWKRYGWARSLFLDGKLHVSKGRTQTLFRVSSGFALKPVLCSEFFFCNFSPKADPSSLLVVCINDSWFCPYFRNIMVLAARLNAGLKSQSVLYVGHLRE